MTGYDQPAKAPDPRLGVSEVSTPTGSGLDPSPTTWRAERPTGRRDPVDRGPESPLRLPLPSWKATVNRVRKKAKADRVSMMSGSIAYHSFLALFPALIALIGVTQLAHVSSSFVSTLVNGVGKALPHGASTVLTDALVAAHHRTSGALFVTVVAVAISIWSASSAMTAVQTGLDVAYGVPEDRPFVAARLMAVRLLVLVGVLGGLAASLIVFAVPLGRVVEEHIGLGGGAFHILWTVVRWAATVVVVVVLMASIFHWAPNRPAAGWKWLSPGGVFASVGWLLASVALSFYVSNLGSYSRTYGALAGVVVLLLWLYVTAYIVLLGGQLNAELEREAVAEGAQPGGPV